MKIREVEDLLGITRANIRYYEKEGLLSVERKENKYREYNEADISILKKIIVLRKIGVSVEDIRAFLQNEKSLDQVLDSSIEKLQTDLTDLKGSLDIAKKLESEKTEQFDEERYFTLISRAQKEGKGFFDICKDIGKVGQSTFDDTLKYLFGEDYKELWSRKGVKATTVFLLIYIIIYLLGKYGVFGEWFKGSFSFILSVLYFTAVIGFPILFVRKKYPGLAHGYFKAVVVLEILLLLYFLYFLVGSIINIFIL